MIARAFLAGFLAGMTIVVAFSVLTRCQADQRPFVPVEDHVQNALDMIDGMDGDATPAAIQYARDEARFALKDCRVSLKVCAVRLDDAVRKCQSAGISHPP